MGTAGVSQPGVISRNLVVARQEAKRAIGAIVSACNCLSVAYFARDNYQVAALLQVENALGELKRAMGILQDAQVAAEVAAAGLRGGNA